jgi:enoyl-CoA hydratase/carnithine racemase
VTRFEEYADAYRHIAMRREDGILEVRVHTDGDSLYWALAPHAELADAFRRIARDRGSKVMILTGTGERFSGPRASEVKVDFHAMPTAAWEEHHADGVELIDALLSIPAVVVAAVNGPALRHAELPLMSDIVLCAEEAEFQDSAHFVDGLTPGDGISVLTPLIMGLTRSRYFHLTGQVIGARQALDWGMVNEVLPKDALLDRAWELARQLTRQDAMILRHTRLLFVRDLKRRMADMVDYGLALEGLDMANAMTKP